MAALLPSLRSALADPSCMRMLGGAAWLLAGRLAAAAAAPAGGGQAAFRQQAWLSSSSAHAPRLSDLLDLHSGPFGSPEQQASPLRVLEPGLKSFGGVAAFFGQVSTVCCYESNVHVHAAVKEDGRGRVLVIDNGASMRAAVLGDILTEMAHKHGWAGIVVNGCIRDATGVGNIPIGVKALGLHPLKPGKGEPGVRDVTVVVGGVSISPGHWLYSDEDGTLVSPEPLEMPDAEQLKQLQEVYRHSKPASE